MDINNQVIVPEQIVPAYVIPEHISQEYVKTVCDFCGNQVFYDKIFADIGFSRELNDKNGKFEKLAFDICSACADNIIIPLLNEKAIHKRDWEEM